MSSVSRPSITSMVEFVALDDADDSRLRDYVGLRDVQARRSLEVEHGFFIAEGEKVVRRALESGHRPRSFLMAPRWHESLADVLAEHDAPCYVLSEERIESVTGFHVHRGALASLERPAPRTADDVLRDSRRVVVIEDVMDHTNVGCSKMRGESSTEDKPRRSRIAVLENLVDHANVGAVFRSAAALGVDAVLVTPSCADPLYRRSIKVSMGTVFQVPWARIDPWPDGIDLLKDAGYVVAGMTLGSGAIPLDELVVEDHERLALLFGTEGHGITPQVDRRLDRRVTIPMMHGVDSLNVAASSAVVFYATKQSMGSRGPARGE